MRHPTRMQVELLKGYAIDGRNHDHPATKCGHCGRKWTRSTGTAGQVLPQPGGFCICAYCATVCRYTEDMQGRPVSAKELRQLPRAARRQIAELQESMRAMIARVEEIN